MADLNQPNIFIQVRIKEHTEAGEFNSAIYYTPEEFEQLTNEQVATQKQTVARQWSDFVKEERKRVPVEPTVAELEVEKSELESRLNALSQRINDGKQVSRT